MEKNLAEYISINATFILDNEIQLIFKNIPFDAFEVINTENISELFQHKWYMHDLYDTVNLLGSKYVIVGKTKKKVELVRYNEKVNK
jgi:hypothetical protein